MIASHAYVDGDAAANLLERRWFAANNAAVALRGECEVLREVSELAEAEWHRARMRLARLEALREAFAEELADRGGPSQGLASESFKRAVNSAA